MDNDDLPVGRVLSRREALKLLTLGGATVLAGCERGGAGSAQAAQAAGARLPGCVVRPEMIEGPYFVDARLDRSDIRPDASTGAVPAGVPLALAFHVSRIDGGRCAPLAGAMVDVWQCDAQGVYSGFADTVADFDSRGRSFLRGFQVTDAGGAARFTTLYPGWYPGRAVHIHFKVRAPAPAPGAGAAERSYEFTSQLFFDDALTDRVHAQEPYARNGRRDTTNARDAFYRDGGDQLLLAVTRAGAGYAATFDIGLDLSDTAVGAPDGRGRRPPPPRG